MKNKTIQIKEIEDFKTVSEVSNAHDINFRTVTKFLWLPKTIDGKTKWLCIASWEETFKEVIDSFALNLGSMDCLIWEWVPTKWIEK